MENLVRLVAAFIILNDVDSDAFWILYTIKMSN